MISQYFAIFIDSALTDTGVTSFYFFFNQPGFQKLE